VNLETLTHRADIWRGGDLPSASRETLATGFAHLDRELPGGGWASGELTEILSDHPGALRLVLPALARLSAERRWIALVAPPHVPYAPALAMAGIDLARVLLIHPRAGGDNLWAIEQALRSGTCSAVLAWFAGGNNHELRRLQLAAGQGHTLGVLFRPVHAAASPSPARLRLAVAPIPEGLEVEILKRRGHGGAHPVHLPDDHAVAVPASAVAAAGNPCAGRPQ